MSLAKELLAARRGRQPPDWLLEAAQDARRQLGSRGYAAVREAAVGGGLRPFDAMVAWQMAQGHSLDAAVRIAAAIAARKRG
jgi:hypothetical protein